MIRPIERMPVKSIVAFDHQAKDLLEPCLRDIERIINEGNGCYATKVPQGVELPFHKGQIGIGVFSCPPRKAAERTTERTGLRGTRQYEFADRFGPKQPIVDRLLLQRVSLGFQRLERD